MSNESEPEVIYGNDAYRVEKIGVNTDGNVEFKYAVINNEWNVTEIETKILAQALNDCDELQKAIDKFFQSKAFELDAIDATVIETA